MKLAIVHVTAAPEAVLQRAERRAASTGRVVPQEVRGNVPSRDVFVEEDTK